MERAGKPPWLCRPPITGLGPTGVCGSVMEGGGLSVCVEKEGME